VTRLDPDGYPYWFESVHSQDDVVDVYSIAAMPDGSFAISGDYASSLSFSTGLSRTANVPTRNPPEVDMFVARFAPDGKPAWVHSWGGANYDEASDVVVDSDGKLLVTGWYAGPVRFGEHVMSSTGWLSAPLLRLEP
jgi:hypothetical protein